MEVCEIGNRFRKVKRIGYGSDLTFLDFDIVILDYHSILFENYQHYKVTIDKRKENLEEFLQHKKVPLILFAPSPTMVKFQNRPEQSLDSIIPVKPFNVVKETGYKINVIQNTIFTNFLKKYEEHFLYTSYFNSFEGTIIAEAPFTKKVLAFYNETSIFLPELKNSIESVEEEFINDLIEVATKIKSIKVKEEFPTWANKYFLPNEKFLCENITRINQDILELQSLLQEKEQSLSEIGTKKILFTGTGDNLEQEVESIFRELGIEVIETNRNRDDLIVKYGNKIAVVEIKGVTGTSAEKHSSQLEKWVNIYYENNEILPKGILIVNTYKDKEISQRSEESFPHQMLEFSEMRKHCLITSLQLLGLYYSATDEKKREELIESLFATIGIYKGFENWREFIEE